MSQGYSTLGFLVIMILYAAIGLLAAGGAISVTRKIFGPRGEQVFYGMFLILIAAFYLAFAAYFGNAAAWRAESAALVVFCVVGGFRVRLPIAPLAGDPPHRLWGLLPELPAPGAFSALPPAPLTAV